MLARKDSVSAVSSRPSARPTVGWPAPVKAMTLPPVYRPQTGRPAQPKAFAPVRSAVAPPVSRPAPARLTPPPLVYRPQGAAHMQAKASVAAAPAGALPVYRVPTSVVGQLRVTHPGPPQTRTSGQGTNPSYCDPFRARVIQQTITVRDKEYTADQAAELLKRPDDVDKEIRFVRGICG